MPRRFFLAGTCTAEIFSKPGSVKLPAPFLCTEARIVASSAAITRLTTFGSVSASPARWAISVVRPKVSLIGFIGLADFAAELDEDLDAVFLAGVGDFFAVAIGYSGWFQCVVEHERELLKIVGNAFGLYGADRGVAAGMRLATSTSVNSPGARMSDDPKKTSLDRKLIELDDPHEIKSWCESLGCTERELRETMQVVGDSADKVREHLKAKR